MRVVIAVRLVRAPTVGPDLGRAEELPAGAQDDSEWLVVENQRQACHVSPLPVAGRSAAEARGPPASATGNALLGNS
jgi:hypothetical protein